MSMMPGRLNGKETRYRIETLESVRARLKQRYPDEKYVDVIDQITADDLTYENYAAIATRNDTQYAVKGKTGGWRVVLDILAEGLSTRGLLPSPAEVELTIQELTNEREKSGYIWSQVPPHASSNRDPHN